MLLSYQGVASLFGRPQTEAAERLGISLTSLKEVCRKLGVPRWPYRRGVLVGDPVSTASGVKVDGCSDSDDEAHEAWALLYLEVLISETGCLGTSSRRESHICGFLFLDSLQELGLALVHGNSWLDTSREAITARLQTHLEIQALPIDLYMVPVF